MTRFVNTKFSRSVMIDDGLVYPCTIVAARYGGVYEGGAWLAFPCDETQLPSGWDSDDVTCSEFFSEHIASPIGKGDTPNDALKHLLTLIS